MLFFSSLLVVLLIFLRCALADFTEDLRCNVRTRIDTGWVCGLLREADGGEKYASFRGVPYARQPVGELRFKELQPATSWPHHLDATEEGPICPQHDELYHRLLKPYRGMSEACIFANVHVPFEALPVLDRADDYEYHLENNTKVTGAGLPIYVFIHGGGFQAGSGDTDLHGPEYLVSKRIIVITFNYRLDVFGFLSIPPEIPGNNGLRDQLTLLRWVKRNARAFGGDPDDITLGGQSAGASCAHLLSLSDAAKGLFKRVVIMSGTGIPAFYTSSPIYASLAASKFLLLVGINATDPKTIHEKLVNTPIETILKANNIIQYDLGLVLFTPVVEGISPGFTRIIDDEPTALIKRGRGNEYPLVVGFTTAECEFFRWRVVYLNILRQIQANPIIILPAGLQFSTPPNVALYLADKVIDRYSDKNENLTYDGYLESCRDIFFQYPAFKLSQWRSEMHSAPVYLYQFSYESDFNLVKEGLRLEYRGVAHVEDLTFIFKDNAILGDMKTFIKSKDDLMRDWFTTLVVNFIKSNKPSYDVTSWPQVHANYLNYQDLREPGLYINRPPTYQQADMIQFYDRIHQIARNSSVIGALPTRGGSIP